MPISRYPRRGHPIVPRLLVPYLIQPSLFDDHAFGPVDASIWNDLQPEQAKLVAEKAIKALSPQLPAIASDLAEEPLVGEATRVRLDDLELEVRTYNCLKKAVDTDGGRSLSTLTIGDAMHFRSFGIKSLVDLLTSIESASQAGGEGHPEPSESLDKQSATKTIPENFAQLVREHGNVPRYLMNCIIPAPPVGVSLKKMGFRNRTLKRLKNAGFGKDPQRLGHLTIAEALRFPSFGMESIIDLVTVAQQWAKRWHNAPGNVLRLESVINAIQGIPGAVNVSRDDPRFGGIMRGMGVSVLTLGQLATWRLESGSFLDMDYAEQLINELKSAMRMSIEEECLAIMFPNDTRRKRNSAIVSARFGFKSGKLLTLKEVGDKFGYTRERVRQLCSPAGGLAGEYRPFAPSLDAAIGVVRASCPATAEKVEAALVGKGLIANGTGLESVIAVAGALGRACSFVVEKCGSSRVVFPPGQTGVFRKVQGCARRLISKGGATTIENVAGQVSADAPAFDAAGITAALEFVQGFHWLDRERGWFTLVRQGYNSLRERIRKVLSVASRVQLSELRTALRRDYRFGPYTPPASVLKRFLSLLSECKVGGEEVIRSAEIDSREVLGGNEQILIGILQKNGNVQTSEQLETLALHEGVSGPSLWRLLMYSVVICRYAKGVYGLVGANVGPAAIEELSRDRCVRSAPVLLDHGWTKEGAIWIAFTVSAGLLRSGALSIPAAKRGFLQGSFVLQDNIAEKVGKLIVKDYTAWGIGPFLRATAVEAGEHLVLIMDQKRRVARAMIGDEGVVERMAMYTPDQGS